MTAQRFLIADDHPLFRSALRGALITAFPSATIDEVGDIEALQRQVSEDADIDLLLLDLKMPGAQGFSALIHLQAQHPEIPVMVVSASESDDVMCRAIDHGASGFLPKSSSPEQISTAIEQVLAGQRWLPENVSYQAMRSNEEKTIADVVASLTPQQFRVASYLVQGLLNKQIAWELSVTEATVKAHITEIFRKLGVHSRTQAVLQLSQLDVSPEVLN
ncbi:MULTISPECIES: response regulator transcription factor [Spongiibacter]|uniref:response regulator n=1 Tax=Spongiibacter TaxID=630749 RepID=UPI000C390D44|nr:MULTISPECIES: response regulator transcription factor [Spongiibacter]MAY38298.1 DNA-binding response regulator [Spongiibacter sp.]MBI56833.1 DNA-binding response regulator [Spongiibacter sp.]MBO6752548.1 response regulator transcription factor [Spongiibacter sp.]MBU71995.1 DNA-binding response regulator [Spongiibacter sp.]|tara:strand:+ start:18537 stop:19190 length:654 start_codon:yes stop_codon:yes gene_type:complete